MNLCSQFDKYRDGELDAVERRRFEVHRATCRECQARAILLDNVVGALRKEVHCRDIADRIAHEAFRKKNSWDALVISWLHPRPVMATVVMLLALFSFVWLVPGWQVSGYSEYETLLDEAAARSLTSRVLQSGSDSELVMWLEQEGNERE